MLKSKTEEKRKKGGCDPEENKIAVFSVLFYKKSVGFSGSTMGVPRGTLQDYIKKSWEAEYPSKKSGPEFPYTLLQPMINIYRGTSKKTKNLLENDSLYAFDCIPLEACKFAYTYAIIKSIKVPDNGTAKAVETVEELQVKIGTVVLWIALKLYQ